MARVFGIQRNGGAAFFAAQMGAGVNLAGAACTQASISGTGAITVQPADDNTIELVGANCVQLSHCSAGAITIQSDGITPPVSLRVPYATPNQFIRKYGLDEATQLLADELQLLTSQLLLDAIAGVWTGTPTAPEKAAAVDALARMARQIDVSSNFMDGYLRGAYTLPFPSDTPNAGVLEDCCLALVRCGLADDSDNATERIDEACKTWRMWLKDVQAGRVTLTAPDGEAVPTRSRVRTGQAKSNFNWSAFGRSR